MKLTCFVCEEQLERKGAIILSPPLYNPTLGEIVGKYHICFTCWTGVLYPLLKDKKAEMKFKAMKEKMNETSKQTKET